MQATESLSTPPYTLCLTLAYDGTHFAGLARQANQRTVAGELEGAFRAVDPRASALRAVSRTDAGVHARGQIVAVDVERDISLRGWTHAVSRELPSEIAIVRAARAPAGFDPRAHVRSKTYRYVVHESVVRDPFIDPFAWHVYERLNLSAMQREAASVVGEHDFAAFRSSTDERTVTVRTMFRTEVGRAHDDPSQLIIEVCGGGFLHRMVRIIAGTLVDVGRGRRAPGAVERAFDSKDRADLGMTAPPNGLCLDHVELDIELDDAWPDRPQVDRPAPLA